jgi:hypothetical protein
MYEQASHSLLNEILVELKPEIGNMRLRHFYTRLGANFYAIHSLFSLLYGDRPDFKQQMVSLVETLAHALHRARALRCARSTWRASATTTGSSTRNGSAWRCTAIASRAT